MTLGFIHFHAGGVSPSLSALAFDECIERSRPLCDQRVTTGHIGHAGSPVKPVTPVDAGHAGQTPVTPSRLSHD